MGVAILDSFRKFNGQIDEVAIYNRALTPEEVQQHYENGLAGEPYCSPPLTLEERVTALEEALEEKEGRIEELENWRTTIDDWKVTINEQVDSLTNQINDIWEWLEEHIPRGLQKASSGGKGK